MHQSPPENAPRKHSCSTMGIPTASCSDLHSREDCVIPLGCPLSYRLPRVSTVLPIASGVHCLTGWHYKPCRNAEGICPTNASTPHHDPVANRKCRPGCSSDMPSLAQLKDPGYTWWDLYNVSDFFHSHGFDVFIVRARLTMDSDVLGVGLGLESTRSTYCTLRVFHHGFCCVRVRVIGLRLLYGARFSTKSCT
jgi:hypothetical protein